MQFIDLRQLDRARADYVRAYVPRPGIGRPIKDWDNVMSAVKFIDPFESFRKALQPDLRPEWLKTSGEQFWRNQDRALSSVENLARGWFERRHAGTRAAQDAVVKIFSAEKPLDALQGYQQWMSGAFDRLMADSVAVQQYFTVAGAAMLEPVSPSPEGPKASTQAAGGSKADSTAA